MYAQLRSICRLPLRHARSRAIAFVTSATSQAMVSVKFQPLQPGTSPALPRSGHSAATLPASHSHDVIVFGGYTEASDRQRAPTNEAWIYSRTSNSWEQVLYSSQAVPQPRLTAQTVAIDNKLWLIGGWNSLVSGSEAFLSDVWTLDLKLWEWEQVKLQGELLQGISRFQAVAVGPKIYVHTHRTDDHILVINTETSQPELQRVPVKGPAPSSRGLHSLVQVGQALYLFGGAPQKGPMLNDLWKLDLDTMAWQQLTPAGITPHERCSTAAAAAGQYILYFGGAFYGSSGGLEMLQDVFVLDTATHTWLIPRVLPTESSSSGGTAGDSSNSDQGLPAARNASIMVPLSDCSDSSSPTFLLHAGWRAFVETYNDTFIVSLEW
eukprot:GHRR01009873.1.p1 GENE.GHRR01009873.1~~GHRR01009873.1.p1  ORF type:complete len:380 (+),score=81.08 GHRR01009873.1:187-1326(+)